MIAMPNPESCCVIALDGAFAGEIRSLLYHAYRQDPAWSYVLEAERPGYDERVRATLRELVQRHLGEPLPALGLFCDDSLVGVALLTPPLRRLEFVESWAWRLRMISRVGLRATRRFIDYHLAVLASLPAAPYHLISLLAVHPAYQGQHFGEQLFQAVHDWCAEEGGSRGVLLESANQRFQSFYLRQGYREIGEVPSSPVAERLFARPHASLPTAGG